MIAFRSLVFNIAFYVNLTLFLVLGAGFFLTPRKVVGARPSGLGQHLAVAAAGDLRHAY